MFGLTKGAMLAAKGPMFAVGAVVATVAVGTIAYCAWQAAAPAPIAGIPAGAPAPAAPPRAVVPADHPQAAATLPAVPPPALPAFDVVRVEPSGDAVVAGRAAANAKVVLLDRGSVIAETTADANGQFAFVPPPLAAGDHLLALGQQSGQGQVISAQTAAVAVPKKKGRDNVIVALTEPDHPTRLLSDPAPPIPAGDNPSKPGDAATIAIRTVEMEEQGGFFATGSAAPGAEVRLYLNGSEVADLHAGPNGSWSLDIAKGMQPGSYVVRADQIDAASGKVVARAEVPFDYRAFAEAKGPVGHPAKDTSGNAAVVAAISLVTVVHGDSLWRISRKVLGRGNRYTQIYAANASQIRDPRLIYPGQVLVRPQTSVN